MSSIDTGPKGGPSWDPRQLGEQSGAASPTEVDPNAPQNPNAQGAGQPGKGAKAPGPGAAPNGSASALAAAAALGSAGVADAAPLSAGTSTKLSGASTVLATPPPLPPTRGLITQDTATNYKSLMDDVGEAMGRGTPAAGFDVKSFVDQAKAHNLATPQGQQALQNQVQKAVVGSVDHFNTMSDAAMMAAFLELNVRNAASGKELQGNMLNLATMSRNNSIEQSIQEREAQAAALKKAYAKQKALAPLMTILKVLVLAITAIATVLTFGASAPLFAIMAAAMTAGALIGGSVKGSKNGKGFDLSGALDGAGYALDIIGLAAIAKVVLKFAVEALLKLGASKGGKAALKKGSTQTVDPAASGNAAAKAAVKSQADNVVVATARKTADHVAKQASKAKKKADDFVAKTQADANNAVVTKGVQKVGAAAAPAADNASWATKAVTGMRDAFAGRETDAAAAMQLWAQALPTAGQIALQLGQAGVNYATQQKTLEAKGHEAMAKQYTAMADAAQMQWEDLQSSIQGITDAHNHAVDQAMEMVNRKHRTAQKAVGLIAG